MSNLYEILNSKGATKEEIDKGFPYVSTVTSRILGTAPSNVSPVFYFDRKLYGLYNYMVPRYLNIPSCDLRAVSSWLSSSLPPKVRSAVMFACSDEYQCNYCMEHCCSLGNIFDGARLKSEKDKFNPDQVETKLTLEATTLARSCVKLPIQVTEEQIAAVRSKFGKRGLAEIAGFCGIMGWLNFFLRFIGAEPEDFFAQGGRIVDDSFITKISTVGKLLSAVSKIRAMEMSWFEDVNFPPHDDEKKASEWMKSKLGSVPIWFERLHSKAKDSTTALIYITLLRDGLEIDLATRFMVLEKFSQLSKNDSLIDFCTQIKQHHEVAEMSKDAEEVNKLLEIVEIVSAVPHPILDEERSKQLLNLYSEKGVVQFIALIGALHALHRITSILH